MTNLLENYKPYSIDNSQWDTALSKKPSRELSVAYVQRYNGPYTKKQPTTHNFWEIGAILGGKTELHLDKTHFLKYGDIFLLAPNTVHFEYAPKKMEIIWIGLTGSALESIKVIPLRKNCSPELVPWFETIWQTAHHCHGSTGPELEGLAKTILSRFLRFLTNESSTTINLTLEWMEKNYARNFTVSLLAEILCCSEGHLYRLFKKYKNQTPIQTLTKIRLRHALQMMENTNLKQKEIAKLVGYKDPLYFSRILKKTSYESSQPFTATQTNAKKINKICPIF
ncbi:MAG: AraC family transcriptional regulator [Sedimentisphaeraceae bacterium JB056]